MSLKIFDQSPYFDDFDEDKNYLRVLFKPGVSLQVRELNQLQTYLQTQIERLGLHLFKDGAMVIPGQSSLDTEIAYLKIESETNNVNINTIITNLVGATVTGQTSGVTARIAAVSAETNSDSTTLFVRYTTTGTDKVTKRFALGEVLIADENTTVNNISYTVQIKTAVDSIGQGSIASIERGIYFVKGQFTLVDSQTIIISKYSNTPSCRIGLTVAENIVNAGNDDTLNDNANGAPNANAPGADRYQIQLTFSQIALDSVSDNNFIELIRVDNGIIQSRVTETDYSILNKTLARRTFDESGHYTVSPFKISVREHRNNNRGEWASNTDYLIGDIITSGGNYFVALKSGTSGSTSPSLIFDATSPYPENGVSDGQINWNYTKTPPFNRGYLTPEKQGDEDFMAVAVEPGKAYVQGYEVEKISTEYIKVPKAREYSHISDDAIPINYGNYILVNNVRGLLDCSTFPKVSLYNQLTRATNPQTSGSGTLVGTARIRAFEFDSGTPGTATGVYRAYLFDTQMVSSTYTFERDVKQVFLDTGTTVTNVVADVTGTYVALSGLITATGVNVTGSANPAFTTELKVGDYIRAITSIGVEQRRVATITSASALTVDSAFTGTFSSGAVVYSRVQTAIVNPGDLPLLFPLAYSFIRSVRATNDVDSATAYTTTQRFDGSTQTGQTSLTIAINQAVGATTLGDEFNPAATAVSDWIVINTTTGSIVTPTSITFNPNLNETEVTIAGLTASNSYSVFAPVRKRGTTAREKTKTLKTNQVVDFTSVGAVSPLSLSLGKADAYRVVAILMSKSGWTASSNPADVIDISQWFTFDNGQRDTHYDVAKIIRRDGYPVPTGAVRVVFDYFSHSLSTAGDYFTVNSYKDVPYNSIPYYTSSTGLVALADVMDFRPRIDDAGLTFNGTGSSRVELPKIGFETSTSYSYYLPRSDKVGLSPEGQFFTAQGISSLTPEEPNDPSIGMMIAKLRVSAYTMFPSIGSVAIETIDNRRYTMRDIGKLDRRIETLEYYTSLSLLEQETKSMAIPDTDGLDRFKNGFIVDSFKGQDLGDVGSMDYSCSIDMSAKELRPFYTMSNVNLLEENQLDVDRTADGYALTGDVITLAYTERELIKQPFASRTENVNPFAIFTFLGNMALNPPSDEWFEVNRRPDIINNVEGNFNAVQAQYQAKGVLGTVWGAWETQWVGQTQNINRLVVTRGFDSKDYGLGAGRWMDRRTFTQAELQAIGGDATSFGNGAAGARVLTFSTPATSTIQGRVGVTTTVTPRIDYQVVEDRVLQSALIPYMRSRELMFVCKGLKPNTKLTPFFDDTAIAAFITPATKISIASGNNKEFNVDVNAGGAAEEVARQVNTKAEVAYNKGDVVYVKQRNGVTYNSQADSLATGIAVLTEKSAENGAEAVYVLNIKKGTFQVGDVIRGSISGAEYTISSAVTQLQQGGDIVSNFNGSVAGVFSIPNTDSIRFRTGIREFKLTDSASGGLDYTTQGRSQYRAQGVLETKQKTINAVRNAEVSVQPASETRPWTVYGDEVLTRDTGWYDPLAQTFLVQSTGGAFITKADVFFATRDISIPVTLQIREVVNGYPGQKILPFSRVTLTPDRVNVDATGTLNLATSFVFESPVYLEDNVEYCLVLLSDSNNYRVWIAQLGEKNKGTLVNNVLVGGDRFISEQPYAGVLFKSQNASTWTANQEQDLKFTIHSAVFNKNANPVVNFNNEPLPAILLQTDPFRTTSGSSKVRVYAPNHGMLANSVVAIRGIAVGTYNGIVVPNTGLGGFNNDHSIVDAERDSFVIDVGANATASGFVGGDTAIATINIGYDAANLLVASQTFNDTALEFSITPMNESYLSATTETSVVPNITTYFDSPNVVASEKNATKSLKVKARLTTDNENVSPVIDTSRMSLITIKNKIDAYTVSSKNDLDIDTRTVLSATTGTDISFSGKVISIANASDYRSRVKGVTVGKYITIAGTGSSTNNVSTPILVTSVAADGSTITTDRTFTTQSGTTAVITMLDNYVSDITPVGSSSESKYVTQVITLAKPSSFLKVMFSANVPAVADSDIQVWFKALPTGSTTDISQFNYIQAATPVKAITKTSNPNTFYDIEYDIDMDALGLPAFDALSVKLVFKSSNSARVPRVKDLRIIACA